MRRMYIWEQSGWPNLHYQAASLLEPLGAARRRQGELSQDMARIGFEQHDTRYLDTLTTDAIETSAIEGVHVDWAAVRSSVAERLGMVQATLGVRETRADGVAAMTVDATRNFAEPLTPERIFQWHNGLFPSGKSEGREMAPPADRVTQEMQQFLNWFTERRDDGLIRSALAHLWFLTIHPFEDGNGRIARAIADMALAQDDQSPRRFFSMTRQIHIEQKAYYDILERTQSGGLDVTEWIVWFLQCYVNAIDKAKQTLEQALRTSTFWSAHTAITVNERQRKVLNLVLDGYEGNINTRNYARLSGTSKDTAQRDLSNLVEQGVLRIDGAGRSTHYVLLE